MVNVPASSPGPIRWGHVHRTTRATATAVSSFEWGHIVERVNALTASRGCRITSNSTIDVGPSGMPAGRTDAPAYSVGGPPVDGDGNKAG